MTANRDVSLTGRTRHEVHVLGVEFAVLHLDFDRHMVGEIIRKLQFVMHHLSRARRNLVVVKWDTNVLRVTATDPLAFLIEHEDIDAVCPGVDGVAFIHPTRTSNNAISACNRHIDPDFV